MILDTNIFLELLLEQRKKAVVEKLLSEVSATELYVSDFSVYSIGIRMVKMKLFDQYDRFVEDTLMSGNTRMLGLLMRSCLRYQKPQRNSVWILMMPISM